MSSQFVVQLLHAAGSGFQLVPGGGERGPVVVVVAVGGDLAQAYLNAEYIEDVAKIYTIARSVGTPVELKSL